MPALHKNRVKMTVTGTPGTGTITLNAASSAHQSFAAAYGANATVDILITDGTAWEVARNCTYTHSGTTVTRGTLEASSTGSAISLTSAAIVEEILTAGVGNSFTDFVGAWGGLTEENAITAAATAVFGKLNVCTGTTSDYEVALPAVSGNAGKYLGIRMDAALTKLVTLNADGAETIDGALTRIMWAKETALLYCNGTTWTKMGGTTIPMTCSLKRTTDQSITSLTWTACPMTSQIDGLAAMYDSGNSRVKIVRPGKYLVIVYPAYSAATQAQCYLGPALNSADASGHVIGGAYTFVILATISWMFDCVVNDYINACAYVQGTAIKFDGAAVPQIAVTEIPVW